jgi:hypothetical protein
MPTIELISIECADIPELPDFESFSFEAECALQSHRGLFQSKFDEVSGVIVHLANKRVDGTFGGFAGNLIDWSKDEFITLPEGDDTWRGEDQLFQFQFEPSIVGDLKTLIMILMESSPRKEVWFSTDIQFGPSKTSEESTTLDRFFHQIESSALFWHRLYMIKNWRTIDSGIEGVNI